MAKFEGLEPPPCEYIKGIVASEEGPKSLGTFEKQAPGPWPRLLKRLESTIHWMNHFTVDRVLSKLGVAGWRNGHQPHLPPLRSL